MAKFEGEATPKSLTGRREDTGFASLQAPSVIGTEQFPQYQSAPPMTYQPGPTSSGLGGRPGASRMEPAGYSIPASGVLATGPPGMPMTTSQGFPLQQGSGPGIYAPQLSVPAQEPVYMEAVNTDETSKTLDNFPSVSGLQPVPYTGADPPTPPQALSQLDLNATVWNPPSTQQYSFTAPQYGLDAQPPSTITTVPSQSLPVQASTSQPNYPMMAPQSSSLPPQSTKMQSVGITTSGGLRDMQADKPQDWNSARVLPSSTTVQKTVSPRSRSSRDPSPPRTESPRSKSGRTWEPPQSIKTIEADRFADSARPYSVQFSQADDFPKARPSSSKLAKPFDEKDMGKSADPKDFKYKESEKENLISEIRERDATIARLLGEVREKRATRLREVERLSEKMDHLEARLLSGHIDPH